MISASSSMPLGNYIVSHTEKSSLEATGNKKNRTKALTNTSEYSTFNVDYNLKGCDMTSKVSSDMNSSKSVHQSEQLINSVGEDDAGAKKTGAWRGRNRGKTKKSSTPRESSPISDNNSPGTHSHQNVNTNMYSPAASVTSSYPSVPSHYRFPPPTHPATTVPVQHKTYAKMMQTPVTATTPNAPRSLVHSNNVPSKSHSAAISPKSSSLSNHTVVNSANTGISYKSDFPSLIPMTDSSCVSHKLHVNGEDQMINDVGESATIKSDVKSVLSDILPEDEEGDAGKKKRRRRRRRRSRKNKDEDCGEDKVSDGSAGIERAASSSNVSESTLHFEDVEEFPDLLTASSRLTAVTGDDLADRSTLSGTSMSYSDVMKSVS